MVRREEGKELKMEGRIDGKVEETCNSHISCGWNCPTRSEEFPTVQTPDTARVVRLLLIFAT
jgi:hypothetical protein